MSNYNTTDTSYSCFDDMVFGIAGDWYFIGDMHVGYEKLQEHIAADDFTDVLELFTSWNENNPNEMVTSDTIKDVSARLVEWYKQNRNN